ncbi:MAG: hypothetical protein K6D97_03680 [Clostridia bacterium]|nr:hypothetical protein [Clostridia bacterium]
MQNKEIIWIFSKSDFKVKEIDEVSDYTITIDEETNGNSSIIISRKTTAVSNDIVMFKKNGIIVYWGIVKEVSVTNGQNKYTLICKYITNIFDRTIPLGNTPIIRTQGLEKFLENEILANFTNSLDTFFNMGYISVVCESQTIKQISVDNVENGIYNFHTWLTNCTQKYGITYNFTIVKSNGSWKLQITIKNETEKKIIIDTKADNVSDYEEVFETDIVAKVTVLTSTQTYNLYLKNDRTTTTNVNDVNRAEGKAVTVYVSDYNYAAQTALDQIKANTYNHNITFSLYDRYIKPGTPIAIKTKDSAIYDTYISAVTITKDKFYSYICGNIRINFIEKLLKERR